MTFKRSTLILWSGVCAGAVFLWLAVHRGPMMGSDSDLENSKGQIRARDFTLKVLAYPDELQDIITTRNNEFFIDLHTLKGYDLVINFWASWCASCKQEAPLIEKIWQLYKKTGVVVMGVVIHDDPVTAYEYARATHKSYLIAYDERSKMSIDYGLTGVPETLFINKDSHVFTKVVGPLDPLKASNTLNQMLNL